MLNNKNLFILSNIQNLQMQKRVDYLLIIIGEFLLIKIQKFGYIIYSTSFNITRQICFNKNKKTKTKMQSFIRTFNNIIYIFLLSKILLLL